VLKTEKVADTTSQIPVILGRSFLVTANALINYKNGMMKLYFCNMTLELNIFNLQTQLFGFDDMKTSTRN